MTDIRNAYSILVGNLEGKKQLGKTMYRWKDSVKLNVNEIRMGVWTGFM